MSRGDHQDFLDDASVFQLQTRRFVALEVRIVSREEETLQSTCLVDDRIRDLSSFNLQKIDKTVDSFGYFAMNQWIMADDGNISSDTCGKCGELCCWIFSFVRKSHLERNPSIHDVFGKCVLFRSRHPEFSRSQQLARAKVYMDVLPRLCTTEAPQSLFRVTDYTSGNRLRRTVPITS
jgi:hypothetical protein